MNKAHSYDPACIPLAQHFLFGNPNYRPGDTGALAQVIQEAVEDYMREVDARGHGPAHVPKALREGVR